MLARMDIPHSSKVVKGQRVPLLQRPDWEEDRIWIGIAPILILGALGWFAYQFTHSDIDDGAALFIIAAGALAIGIGILHTYFIANRDVQAPCPVCGAKQRWTPGHSAEECRECARFMRITTDGSIQEVSLDATDDFNIMVDDDTFGDAFTKDGHVTLVMPAICAVCGAPPTTTGKVEFENDLRSEDTVRQITAHDLAALAVPLCAHHTDDAPIRVDAYLGWLRIKSYRYYRALLLTNAPHKTAAGVVKPRVTPGQLEPLLCTSCGAPLAVGAGDDTTCAACGHKAPLPEPYKLLRDAKQLSDQDAAQLTALAADIAKPPPPWKRVMMVIGYIVGGVTVLVMALGALIGAIGGAVVGSELGETGAKLLAIVGAVLIGILAVPYAGEVVSSLVMLHSSSASADIINSSSPAFRYDLVAAAILYGLGVIPIALAYRTQGNLKSIVELQGKLAAHASVAGGALCCRHCGAALDVPRDAVVTRCLYCGADNLLTVPIETATSNRDDAKHLDASVKDAVVRHERQRDEDVQITKGLLVVGLVLVPYLCIGGYLFHKILC